MEWMTLVEFVKLTVKSLKSILIFFLILPLYSSE